MHQPLRRVPDHVTQCFFRIDSQQVLENAEKRNLLWGLHDLLVHRVEHVQMRVDVNPVRAVRLPEKWIEKLKEEIEGDFISREKQFLCFSDCFKRSRPG